MSEQNSGESNGAARAEGDSSSPEARASDSPELRRASNASRAAALTVPRARDQARAVAQRE